LRVQEERLSVDLQELTKLLESDEEVHTSLERLVELATTVVPACDGAAITVRSGERLETMAATGARAAELDRSQGRRGQGPVVEALTYGEPRRVDDSRRERRWPAHCGHAQELELLSSITLPMRVDGVAIAALSLYGRQPEAFGGVSHDIALLLAARGGATLAHARDYQASQRLVRQLQEALTSRSVIEQAKGVIMAREGCGPEEAFDILRRTSQRSHRKLHEVARRLVASVQAPTGPDPAG
jgi:transcriptional regulator with GAF, ATPase, and Fis domain